MKGKLANGVGSQYHFTLPRNMVYPALVPLMHTHLGCWNKKSGFCVCAITFHRVFPKCMLHYKRLRHSSFDIFTVAWFRNSFFWVMAQLIHQNSVSPSFFTHRNPHLYRQTDIVQLNITLYTNWPKTRQRDSQQRTEITPVLPIECQKFPRYSRVMYRTFRGIP